MHALEHERVALLERPPDHGPDPHEDVARLLEKAEERGVRVLPLGDLDRLPGLEARMVDRGHELFGEEGAHRLADDVGGRDAGDPEPVGDLRRHRRLPRPRCASDEQHERHVELPQSLQAPEGVDGLLVLVLGDDGGGDVEDTLGAGGAPLAAAPQLALDLAGQLVRPLGREPRAHERLGHQALGVGKRSLDDLGRATVADAHGPAPGP